MKFQVLQKAEPLKKAVLIEVSYWNEWSVLLLILCVLCPSARCKIANNWTHMGIVPRASCPQPTWETAAARSDVRHLHNRTVWSFCMVRRQPRLVFLTWPLASQPLQLLDFRGFFHLTVAHLHTLAGIVSTQWGKYMNWVGERIGHWGEYFDLNVKLSVCLINQATRHEDTRRRGYIAPRFLYFDTK
jgi:hypothetical protein